MTWSKSKQVLSELPGGLGNQIFAFAAGLALSESNNCKLILDSKAIDYSHAGPDDDIRNLISLTEFEFRRRPDLPFSLRRIRDSILHKFPVFRKRYNDFFGIVNDSDVSLGSGCLELLRPYLDNGMTSRLHLKGYFQDLEIVERVKGKLTLLLKEEFSELGNDLRLILESKNVLGIHVRGGDFLNPAWKLHVGNLAPNYYLEALKELGDRGFEFDEFWVFTNDFDYANELLKEIDINFRFIDQRMIQNPAENFNLLRRCSGLIISNSSFSYMAAYLSIKSRIVMVPTSFSKAGNKIFGIPKYWFEVISSWV